MRRLPLIFLLVLTCALLAFAQEAGKAAKETSTTRKEDPEAQAEATRLLHQRRTQVRSLLISLASISSFSDQRYGARVQARVADAIWDVD
jgi:hypothetical protein